MKMFENELGSEVAFQTWGSAHPGKHCPAHMHIRTAGGGLQAGAAVSVPPSHRVPWTSHIQPGLVQPDLSALVAENLWIGNWNKHHEAYGLF